MTEARHPILYVPAALSACGALLNAGAWVLHGDIWSFAIALFSAAAALWIVTPIQSTRRD